MTRRTTTTARQLALWFTAAATLALWWPAAQALAATPRSTSTTVAKQTPRADAGNGLDQLQQTALTHAHGLIEAYRACDKLAPELPCPALDDLFDFETLSHAPLAEHAARLTKAQQKRFFRAFGDIVRAAARSSGHELTLGEPTVTYQGQKGSNVTTDVHVVRAEDDVDAHVAFVWRSGAKAWQVVDVELDGASMVQDYHNQFGRVLKKDGAEALVAKVESRGRAAQKKVPSDTSL